ncbi:SpoIIE family protein phosphatase [Bullifex porci]|uniref:SpoIIE family protein phosphatase n=1 Tax=Bullifex porci TaxID=2606638 RepID=UPI0023F3281C|nr:SpoIIE family protein phosphatase [Bullifex porci]MDD7256576.1 SpoIIE family protein phosphatase [Bullifex porci]MDY2742199.1 SpoIIE family protein phosphatase [Bullifex porci]
MKIKLLPKFIISLGILGIVITVAVSIFSYATTKSYLNQLYAERIMTNSNAIAAMLDVNDVKKIISDGGEKTPEYKEMYDLFKKLKADGEITFLSLVVPDEDSVTFYIDAMVEEMGDDPALQIPYGSNILYTDAANPNDPKDMEKYITIWENYAKNKGIDKPLVTDNDYGFNYTGISVILDENGKAIAEIQYILDMSEVRAYLNSFLVNMFIISFAIIGITILAYIVFVRKIVINPVGRLTDFTQEITRTNDFENQRIKIKTGDEIESLSHAFNFMLSELENYIDNLSKVTAEKERIGAELDVARHIQASMLPSIFPPFPNRDEFDIYASMTPAKEVGGDFYDFFLVDEDHLAMVIADVSGKGVPAAMFMMISKTLLKSAAQSGLSPKAILEKVNNQLCENNDAEMFVTVWIGILEISTGKLVCANAGHEYPAIMRRGGSFELYKDKHGFVLAGMEGSKYREYELVLSAGDRLFVYTDGVAEATDSNNNLYGTDRMIDALNKAKDLSSRELLESLHKDIDSFVGLADQFDDITMLSIQIKQVNSSFEEISLKPCLDNLDQVTDFIDNHLSEGGVSNKLIFKVNMAIDEIYSNIARYSGATEARVGCNVSENKVSLRFVDNGSPYDPTVKEDPDTTLSAEEREIGGLGIYMVKKIMDEISYEYKDGRNILILEKNI